MSEPRLVDVWSSRVAPDHVLRELRTIDSRAELVYVQRGKWWLGLVYNNIPLIQAGRRELSRIKDEGGAAWPTLRLAQLKAQGFRRIKLPRERWPLEPLWRFSIEWFRKADYCFRHIPNSDQGWEDAFKPHEDAMTNTAKVEEVKKRLVEFVHSDRRSLMRRIQHGAQVGYSRAVNQ